MTRFRPLRRNPLPLAALLALAVLTMTPACASPSQAAPLLKIGLVAPFTGRERNLGYEALFAARLALRQANAGGTLGGYRLELVAEDAGQSSGEAVRRFEKLAADPDVVAVIAYANALPPTATAIVNGAALPAIVFGGPISAPDGTARLINADVEATAAAVAGAMARSGAGAALVVAGVEGSAMSQALAKAGIAATSLAWHFGNPLSLPVATPSFIYVDLPYDGAATVVSETRRLWPNVPLVVGNRAATFDLIRLAGDSARGVYQVTFSRHPNDDARLADFASAYRTLGGAEPGFVAPLVYDATSTLTAALGRSLAVGRPPTRAGVSAALDGEGLAAPLSGAAAWDAAGRRQNASVCLYRLGGAYPGEVVASPGCP